MNRDAFTLTIQLGNDAMQTGDDVADALSVVAANLRAENTAGTIRDNCGNTVGSWELSCSAPQPIVTDALTRDAFKGNLHCTSSLERHIEQDPYMALYWQDEGDPTSCALEARVIASWWHGGQSSALYAFASSGHLDLDGCISELAGGVIDHAVATGDDGSSTSALLEYLESLRLFLITPTNDED